MSIDTLVEFGQGERVHPKTPFFIHRRKGSGKKPNLSYEAAGYESKSRKFEKSGDGTDESSIAARVNPEQYISTIRRSLYGQISVQADYYGSINVNYRFLQSIDACRFFLRIAARVRGDISFSRSDESSSLGTLSLDVLGAIDGDFSYRHRCDPGGHAAKRISIESYIPGSLDVVARGLANRVDFHLRVIGPEPGNYVLEVPNQEALPGNRQLIVYRDRIYGEAGRRVISVRDVGFNSIPTK
jgi:hypothetical protein